MKGKLFEAENCVAVVQNAITTQLAELQNHLKVLHAETGVVLLKNHSNAKQALSNLVGAKNEQAYWDFVVRWFQQAQQVFTKLEQAIKMVECVLSLLKVQQRQVAKLSEDGIDDAADAKVSKFFDSIGSLASEVSVLLYALYDWTPVMGEALLVPSDSKLDKNLQSIRSEATRLLVKLACVSFVVTKEPYAKRKEGPDNFYESYQVITLGNNVKCTVKLLAGYRGCSDTQIKINPFVLRDGKLDNEIAVSQKHRASLHATATNSAESAILPLTATFDSMHCDFIKGKKRREVANLNYNLFFMSEVQINGTVQKLFCRSLPVVMIANVSQECESRSKLFWDNAFWRLRKNEQDCRCVTAAHGLHYCSGDMMAPEAVPWHVFYPELALWFESLTECTLKDSHESFIRRCVSDSNGLVTFRRFYNSDAKSDAERSPLKVTFWIWFFNVKKFVKKQSFLKFLWQNDLLYGFASHQDACSILLQNTACTSLLPNTMLLRFSNSTEEGALVITYGDRQKGSNQVSVKSLEPWESKALDKEHENLHNKLKRAAGNRYKYIYPGREWQPVCAAYKKPCKPARLKKVSDREYVEGESLPGSDNEDSLDSPRQPQSVVSCTSTGQSQFTPVSPASWGCASNEDSYFGLLSRDANDLNLNLNESYKSPHYASARSFNFPVHAMGSTKAPVQTANEGLLDAFLSHFPEEQVVAIANLQAVQEQHAQVQVQVQCSAMECFDAMRDYSGSHAVNDLSPSIINGQDSMEDILDGMAIDSFPTDAF